MRLGVDEVGVTELMGVTEHARAMATAAAALLLESLVGGQPLVPPLALDAADDLVRALLDEIAVIWRILGHNPDYLESTWRKDAALMRAGALSARDKRRTALAVAMAMRARYMIEYNAAILRHAGDTDRDILEILGVVDHYTTLNTLSEGMQIDSDIRSPA